ncbi:hypothetical protein AB0L57_32195 [Nocardia sp. NPDC052254]|uniref:hypothetical protein n=1 Tax=Nocardia sp. NPDC052254 TaxID=3155681 RepID=UPI00342D9258
MTDETWESQVGIGTEKSAERIPRYFSEYFEVDPELLQQYGTIDISVITDLPLFVDPFLLFVSENPKYEKLHDGILKYLDFLKSHAATDLDPGLIDSWYRFPEVRQNWLGFTLLGNKGSGLGRKFALALHSSLSSILDDFGQEIDTGTHLEKLTLLQDGVGKDSVSDFTTNLIKEYLCEYTQEFAQRYLESRHCKQFIVPKVRFDYKTETWVRGDFCLPNLDGDFVLLTPADLLTRHETWINHKDMMKKFDFLPHSLPNNELRAQVNNYFRNQLGKKPTAKERADAAVKTISAFPVLMDQYIQTREEGSEEAVRESLDKVEDAKVVLIDQPKLAVADIARRSKLYELPYDTYDEAIARVKEFKHYIEHNDGYRLINRRGERFSQESEVQVYFGLLWTNSRFDVNREVNNGRGPVDYKISYGAGDKSLIEFKLGSNTGLKRNLQNQVAIYMQANRTDKAIKVIICYTEKDQRRVATILAELDLTDDESIVVIDARIDNKQSASTV